MTNPKNLILVERVMRRLLTEGKEEWLPDIKQLAAYVSNNNSVYGGKNVTIYDVNKLFKLMHLDIQEAAMGAVVGYISVAPSKNPCNGAWEVRYSAGPDLGKLVYGMGFALTPNNRLIPDRQYVSDDAYKGWSKQKAKSNVEKIPLDNYKNPTTPDPSDDCAVHGPGDEDCDSRDSDPLNHAYVGPSWSKSVLSTLEAAHLETVKKIVSKKHPPALGQIYAEEFEDYLPNAGKAFFRRVFRT